MAKIDKRLNLVIPVDTESGTIYVHATAIGVEVYNQFFDIISRTYGAIMSSNELRPVGVRVAARKMQEIAEREGTWGEVKKSLIGEILRLTNICAPGSEIVMSSDAKQRGVIDSETANEVENELVFFTLASWVPKRIQVNPILVNFSQMWDSLVTSSACTEYQASLQTATTGGSTGVTAPR